MTRLLWCGLIIASCVACARKAPPADAVAQEPGHTSPASELERLDSRKPVPLLPAMADHQKQNMRDHLVAVSEIVGALAASDFAAVESAAKRIGLSEQMGAMCNHMGSAAPGFAAQAMEFHRTADGITEAARARDASAVLRELNSTLQACTSCHAVWKQQVVTQELWSQLTEQSSELPPAHSERPHR